MVGWKWHIPQTWINYKCPVNPIWLDKMKISRGKITWQVSCFSPTEDDFGVIQYHLDAGGLMNRIGFVQPWLIGLKINRLLGNRKLDCSSSMTRVLVPLVPTSGNQTRQGNIAYV